MNDVQIIALPMIMPSLPAGRRQHVDSMRISFPLFRNGLHRQKNRISRISKSPPQMMKCAVTIANALQKASKPSVTFYTEHPHASALDGKVATEHLHMSGRDGKVAIEHLHVSPLDGKSGIEPQRGGIAMSIIDNPNWVVPMAFGKLGSPP